MLFDFLVFVVFVVVAPFVLIGGLLGNFFVEFARMFKLPMLGFGVAFANLGAIGWMNRAPNPDARFLSMAEAFGQSAPLGLPMPYVCFAIAGALVLLSYRWPSSVSETTK